MKHKKLLIVAIVVVAMAVAAAVAYAWWSDTVTSDTNTVVAGEVALAMEGLPIQASGLMPQNDPDLDAADGEYADVTYIWVRNDSPVELMFYGWLSHGSDDDNIRPYVNARITLLGSASAPSWWSLPAGWVGTFQDAGPYDVFDGTVAQLWGESAGINYLSSRYPIGDDWGHTPLDVGEYAVYRVAVWLDSTAPDGVQGATLSFKINFTGMQEEGWDAAAYDDEPYDPNFMP
jgi:predicted ribosomally synthesized peptide with SipW-like signal peptide